MESDSLYRYGPSATTLPASATSFPQIVQQALNPPVSLHVIERLAHCLTPPQSMIAGSPSRRQVRSGGYDNLAARCYAEAQRPAPERRWAYEACTQIIREHSKSFYFSARLLPPGKREGIMALYAFCRLSDDLVDNAHEGSENGHIARAKARIALNAWAKENRRHAPDDDHPVIVAWADARSRFGIPQELADELIVGVRMDLTIDRYDTWNDLWMYCYRVASTVGLMSMYITGAQTMDAVPMQYSLAWRFS